MRPERHAEPVSFNLLTRELQRNRGASRLRRFLSPQVLLAPFPLEELRRIVHLPESSFHPTLPCHQNPHSYSFTGCRDTQKVRKSPANGYPTSHYFPNAVWRCEPHASPSSFSDPWWARNGLGDPDTINMLTQYIFRCVNIQFTLFQYVPDYRHQLLPKRESRSYVQKQLILIYPTYLRNMDSNLPQEMVHVVEQDLNHKGSHSNTRL